MHKHIGWLLPLLALAMPVFAAKPLAPATIPGATILDADQLVKKIQTTPELVLIDARRHEVYARGHISGAINLLDIEMTPAQLATQVPRKETPVVFYCNGERCLRSSNAVRKALTWGYRNVYWFRGGWHEWTYEELPISR